MEARRTTTVNNKGARCLLAAVGCVAVWFAAPALAGDGVIEINQASATAGVGFGDAPGFPVTLSLRGSYRLTSELNVPANTSGIIFQNDNISLDLNGFSIVGGGGTSGRGIESVSRLLRSQRVSNGTVRNMGHECILLGSEAHVERVTAIACGRNGIDVWKSSVIENVTSNENGRSGIEATQDSRVLAASASDNGSHGIETRGGVIRNSTASRNTLDGIHVQEFAVITGCTAQYNGDDGIAISIGLVQGNAATFNTGHGIDAGETVGYRDNVLHRNNGGGEQIADGIALGSNACGFVGSLILCP